MEEELLVKSDFNCINCGHGSFFFRYKGYDRLYGIPGEFQILECAKCGLFSISPKLSKAEIALYYPDNYLCYIKAVEDEKNIFRYFDRWRARERRVKQILKRSKTHGRILDVGCATGILLSGMQRYGWECYGVEPNLEAAEYARNRFGLEVFNGYLEDTAFPDDYFDVITMMDVLEHIYDPIYTLKEVSRIIKPGGHFIGNIPNADALERSLFGPYWVGWDMPRHYQVFSRSTTRQLLERHGFNNVELFSFTGRHGAFKLSLKFWVEGKTGHVFLQKIIYLVLGSFFFRVIMYPFFILLEKSNLSTTLSYSARKD